MSGFLAGEATQQGSSKRQQYLDVLGLQAQSQARFLVQRELEKHLDPGVQAPRTGDAAAAPWSMPPSFAAGALGNFDLTAPGKSTTGQIQKQLDRLSGFLGVGAFLVYWAPYIVGTALFATLAFFPLVLLWSLFPGQHFKPIVNYLLLLVFVCSTPLWWAMVNVAADLAHRELRACQQLADGAARQRPRRAGLRRHQRHRHRHGAGHPGGAAVRHLAGHRRHLEGV